VFSRSFDCPFHLTTAGLIPSATKYRTENCLNFLACGMCLYHTRCCFIHFVDVGGAPQIAQDLLETPMLAHLEGIQLGQVSVYSRVQTELQRAIRLSSGSPGRGFMFRSGEDRVLPNDPFERLVILLLPKTQWSSPSLCCIKNHRSHLQFLDTRACACCGWQS
jgi:hypothetical protein